MLEPVGERLWLADGGIVDFYGFAYPTRMVIAEIGEGALWVWSPIGLSPPLQRAVEALGRPAHLVSPNKLHHLYLGEWSRVWPEAKLWGPASTIRKRTELDFASPLEDVAPAAWGPDFDQAWFRGALMMDEIVFLHRPSRTAILGDLSENFSDDFLRARWPGWARWIARRWRIVEGWGWAPLEWRLSWLNRKPARAALETVLGWDPERVVMAHGEWVRDGGRAYLERAFAWLARD